MRAIIVTLVAVMTLLLAPRPQVCRGQEYSIGEGDLLKISVYDNPDLTVTARVGGDGMITFPLIGDVKVDGMTTTAAQQFIADKLREGFIKKPEVTIFIAEYKSKRVTALGEFNRPGLIELRGNPPLLEVISDAGGVTANAGEELVITRKLRQAAPGQATEEKITLQLKTLLEGNAAGTPVNVMDGDSIYIPRAKYPQVSTLGEFNRPGLIELRGSATLMDAISNSGGVTPNAGDEIVIHRKVQKPGETTFSEKEFVVPLAPYLVGKNPAEQVMMQDGDSIYVPRAVFVRVTMLGEFAKPGLLELRRNATLMEAISNAGGVTATAGDDLLIKSKPPAGTPDGTEGPTTTVDLNALLEGRYQGEKTTVADGDSLYVARAAFTFITGAVKAPGAYKITKGLTVLKAITLAGGFSTRASKGNIAVIRKTTDGEKTIPVQMDTFVLPDDVVMVPESLF